MKKTSESKRQRLEAPAQGTLTSSSHSAIGNQLASTLIAEGNPPRQVHRGYHPTGAWGGKYRYGTFSHLVAAYVLAYEFHGQLADLDNWRKEGPQQTGQLVAKIKERYESLSPQEVEMIVELANRGLIGETFEAHWWPVRTPVENLDFVENTMADFSEIETAPGFDASRLNRHGQGDDTSRLTLEPTDDWLSFPDFRGLEPDLHRGAYAPAHGIPHNSIAAHLIAYLVGDRGVEMDILDTNDYKAIVAHDFALNRLTGEYFLPKRFVSKMSGDEVVSNYLGIPHVDRETPNAVQGNFHISFLDDFLDFHKYHIPGMHRALDARNFSSVTAIGYLDADRNNAANPPGYRQSVSVKIYPFTISHGYEHMLYEYAARQGVGRTHFGDLNFEEMKYYKPSGFDEQLTDARYLSVAEREKAKKRADLAATAQAVANGEDKARELAELQKTVSRFDEIETFPEVPNDTRAEFLLKSRDTHVILCVGQVATAAIDDAQKSVPFSTPIDPSKIGRTYQGSESVVALAVAPRFEDNDWKEGLPFGGSSESYFEKALADKHGFNTFSDEEKDFLHHETFRVFQWIATFMGKVHPKSGIQFQASASISDVLEFTDNIRRLMADARHRETNMSADAISKYRENTSESQYSAMADFGSSGLSTRFKLLSAAIIENVQHLISRAAHGSLRVVTDRLADNSEAVREGFAGLYYYGTDRFPDLILAKRADAPGPSGAEEMLQNLAERVNWPELGSAVQTGVPAEAAKRWVYFVVDGKVNPQAGPSFSNQLGGSTGQTLRVNAATTDMPVPHRMLASHGLMHAGLPSSRRYWEHMRTVFRPDIRTDPLGDPAGISRWAGEPFMKKEDLAARLGVPIDELRAYAEPADYGDQQARRQRIVDTVRHARMPS